jgi:hypothetical protein
MTWLKKKTHCCVSVIIEGRHVFDPFVKVIDCHDDVLVSISRWRVATHEVNAPFSKGVDSDDRV